jgi:hypothetical protein
MVYPRHKPSRTHPSLIGRKLEPLEVVYDLHLFFPRTMVVEVGQTVLLKSRDGGANFNVPTAANAPINVVMTPEKPYAMDACEARACTCARR